MFCLSTMLIQFLHYFQIGYLMLKSIDSWGSQNLTVTNATLPMSVARRDQTLRRATEAKMGVLNKHNSRLCHNQRSLPSSGTKSRKSRNCKMLPYKRTSSKASSSLCEYAFLTVRCRKIWSLAFLPEPFHFTIDFTITSFVGNNILMRQVLPLYFFSCIYRYGYEVITFVVFQGKYLPWLMKR